MTKQYILRPTRIHVLPEGEPLYSERATIVQTVNEAAGEFIEIRQVPEQGDEWGIQLNDEEEWNAISAAVADLFAEIGKWAGKDVPAQPANQGSEF